MVKDGHRSRLWQIVLELISGALAALPIGVGLYFVSILIWAWMIEFLAIPVLLIPRFGSHIMGWMDFSRGATVLIVASVVIIEAWFCRRLSLRHYRVFAYTQALLGLAVSSPFFYWTSVHQKPMLPFWGQ